MRALKKSVFLVFPKWVKSNERRKRERQKVSVNNGQYKRIDQNIYPRPGTNTPPFSTKTKLSKPNLWTDT